MIMCAKKSTILTIETCQSKEWNDYEKKDIITKGVRGNAVAKMQVQKSENFSWACNTRSFRCYLSYINKL